MPFEHELKNAYIGEVYEYSYTFKGKTAAEIGNTWNLLTGSINTNSNGVTGSSSGDCRLGFDLPSLANAKKITVTGTVVVGSTSVQANAAYLGIGAGTGWGTGGTYIKIQGSNYSGIKSAKKTNGTTVEGNSLGNATTGTYKFTFVIDFENKSITGTANSLGNSTLTLSDSDITELRQCTYMLAYVSLNYSAISDISIIIE